MGDSEDSSAIPSWQRSSPSESSDAASSSETAATTSPSSDQLQVARRFLQDDAVKDEPREKKAEFLREKGISDNDIETLLAELPLAQAPEDVEATASADYPADSPISSSSRPSPTSSISSSSSSSSTTTDRPPIVTYPEFLTQPPRPPPLVTTNSLLTTLSTFAGLATLLHGTSRYLVQPMHESLTDARVDFHATTATRLSALVSRLEDTVSVVPPHSSHSSKKLTSVSDDGDDADSEADDPTEMFHRDVGTQTSNLEDFPPASPPDAASSAPPASETQATRLRDLLSSLEPLKDSFRTQSTDFHDIGTLIDVFRDDLQGMVHGSKPPHSIYSRSGAASAVNGYSYSLNSYKEPDDEIKKAKDGIRRVKGVLLSTRNFPPSTV